MGLPLPSSLLRAVVVQLPQADGEELHHFARVVLIGIGGGVALVVAQHGEELAHHGIEGHILEQLAEVSEGVGAQHVVVVGLAARHALNGRGVVAGDDEHLRERVLDALAQLVGRGQRLLPEGVLHEVFVLVVLHKERGVALDVAGGAGRVVDDQRLLDGGLRGRGRQWRTAG